MAGASVRNAPTAPTAAPFAARENDISLTASAEGPEIVRGATGNYRAPARGVTPARRIAAKRPSCLLHAGRCLLGGLLDGQLVFVDDHAATLRRSAPAGLRQVRRESVVVRQLLT